MATREISVESLDRHRALPPAVRVEDVDSEEVFHTVIEMLITERRRLLRFLGVLV